MKEECKPLYRRSFWHLSVLAPWRGTGQGGNVVLKPVPPTKFRSFTEIAEYLVDRFPVAEDFPEPPPRPKSHERPIPGL